MAAVTLKDLLDLQRTNAAKGDTNAQKQVERLESIEKVAKQDRVLQAAQVVEAARTEKDDERTADAVEETIQLLKKGLIDKTGGGLNSNMSKLFDLVKKQDQLAQKMKSSVGGLTTRPINAQEAKGITQTAMGRPQYTSIGERLTQMKENAFNVRNFLSATGVVQKGSGGILDTALAKREEKKEYVASRLKMDPSVRLRGVEASKKTFARQFDEQQVIQRSIRENERAISKYERQGFTPEQVGRTEEYKKRGVLATELAKSDPRVRPTGFVSKTGQVREQIEERFEAKEQAKAVNSRKATPAAVPVGTAGASEEKNEANRQREQQINLLKQIEENTRGGQAKKVGTEAKSDSGGLLEGLMGNLVGGLSKAFKFLLNPKSLLKVLTKFALPAAIIGSVVSGVVDGFKAWKETGSISEALIAGVGGILEFLSFGLFDKETIRGIVDGVKGFYTDYIEKPVKEFVDTISEVFTTVKTFFTDAISGFVGMIENISIPKVGFKIPVIDKEVSIGPFYPFKSDTAGGGAAPATAVSAPPAQAAQQVYNKSGDNAAAATPSTAPTAAPVVINAPTNVNSSTTYAPKIPPRNSESSYQQYNRSRFAT